MSRLLFEARAAVLALEAQERVLEKEIELAKLKTFVGLTDTDIDHLSVLAGFDPSHKVELGMVRSVVRSILRNKKGAME